MQDSRWPLVFFLVALATLSIRVADSMPQKPHEGGPGDQRPLPPPQQSPQQSPQPPPPPLEENNGGNSRLLQSTGPSPTPLSPTSLPNPPPGPPMPHKPGPPGEGTLRPGQGRPMGSGDGNDTMTPRPHKPGPPMPPGPGTPRPQRPMESGDGNDTMTPRPHKPGPPMPPGSLTPRPQRPMESGDGNDTMTPRPHKPGPPMPPGPGTPRPQRPMESGDGNDTMTPRPHKPGPPMPPGPGTPRPQRPMESGDGNDTMTPRPHKPGPGPPMPPGPGTPRPQRPMESGDGNDTMTPRPKPGDGTPRPGGPGTTRPKPGRPTDSGSGIEDSMPTRPRPPGPPGDGTRPRPRPGTPKSKPNTTDSNTTFIETSVNQNYSIHMYGGDIALTPEQQATLEATSNQISPFSIQNAVVRSEQYLWKNGIVYFEFDSSLSDYARDAIQEAMDTYVEQTCITFEERTNQEDYVRFFSGEGCYSYIGRVSGEQDISIGRGCEYKGIVMHEILHALGRWHEQSRPDRDLYITVNENNIAHGTETNFEVISTAFATTQAIPYDFGSLMHYDAYAFSRNGRPTIEPLDSSVSLNNLGQREELSSTDLQHVLTLYCDGYTGGSWSEWESWSSCSQTCNGGSRVRSRTCNGGSDCQGSNIDKEQCNTDACEDEATWGDWTLWSECTASCGGGRRTRRRNCIGGNTCVGKQTEYSDCNTDSCPEGSRWSNWGSWSSCSRSCQGGTRLRRRQCTNGNDCSGSNVEVEYCNSGTPCDGSVTAEEWSEWSNCTEPCGNGTQFRSRGCPGEGCEIQSQSCNTQDCNPEPNLRGIEHAGCYWVPPLYSSNLVFLEGTIQELSDNPWEREDPISKCGIAAQQYNFNVFALSVGFCLSGSSNLREYQYFESDFCEAGIGGFYSRWMAMDVYVISDVQSFQDSTGTVAPPTTDPSSSDTVSGPTTPAEVGVESGQISLAYAPYLLPFLLIIVTIITFV